MVCVPLQGKVHIPGAATLFVKFDSRYVSPRCCHAVHLTCTSSYTRKSVGSNSKHREVSFIRLFTVPYYSVGFSRLVRFDRIPFTILVCNGERNLGRVSKLSRASFTSLMKHSLIQVIGITSHTIYISWRKSKQSSPNFTIFEITFPYHLQLW